MASPKAETGKGTDQPWSRPGSLTQNPGEAAPTRRQREQEYEGKRNSGGSHLQGHSPRSTKTNAEPLIATSNINENARVGDPVPLMLIAIVTVPVIIVIFWFLWAR